MIARDPDYISLDGGTVHLFDGGTLKAPMAKLRRRAAEDRISRMFEARQT